MHPILFRIPLPHRPLKAWWALVAIVVVSLVYAAVMQRKQQKDSAIGGVVLAILAGAGAYFARAVQFESPNLPIYSYGVMLGLSLVVGWYLTLGLAEHDKLPKETMANCYVVTAIAAIVGSRILYIVTNLDEFKTFADVFALRRGGLVAYGGFIGGYVGSWFFLARHKLRLLPWADVAVPSLASGLLVTRIGCYLFGCDFGTRLGSNAPGWLKKLGTFPHWAQGTLDAGDGAPAWSRHWEIYRGMPEGQELLKNNMSFPVHPTQLYESLVGLLLLGLLLWQRRHQKFRGQIFFTFVFAYGVARFLLEIIRDDVERGEYGPVMAEHVLIPGALLLLSVGFVFGIALGITNARARSVARVLAFAPPVVAYAILKPVSFAKSVNIQLSTSQLIALVSGLLVSYYYAKYWQDARKNPELAMSLGNEGMVDAADDRDDRRDPAEASEEEAAHDEPVPGTDAEPTAAQAPQAKRKKGLRKKGKKGRASQTEDETTEEEDVGAAGDPAPET